MGESIEPGALPPAALYSLGYRAGNLVWVAGQTAVGDDGQIVGPGDPRAQAECIYRRIGLILEAAGGSPRDITMMRAYVTDIRNQALTREARAAFLQGHKPAATVVQVTGLARPEFLMEVEVMAVIGQPGPEGV